MIKRIVLKHTSGLRQICGILDLANDSPPPTDLTLRGDSFKLRHSKPRYVAYVDVAPEALAEGPKTIIDSAEVTP
jgi:hypothetical protein